MTLPLTGSVLDFGATMVRAFDDVDDVFVFVKDDQRRFVACSSPLARLLGYRDAQQIIGMRDEEVSPEYFADHYRRHDTKILETGESLMDLVELVRNVEGGYDWFVTTKVPVLGSDGRPVGLVGHTRALTSRDPSTEKLLTFAPAVELISAHYDRSITVAEMAATMNLSSGAFSRTFKDRFGCTPYQYLRRTRIMAACDLLSTTDLSLSEISSRSGFYDQSHFSREFRADRGQTPSAYRQQFSGVRSQYATRIPLG
ncbi:AraC family transcriptional regulator [Frondihabitans sucicola]|nr:AraC family transcriptional regulator [Frondihabitans sucicola]